MSLLHDQVVARMRSASAAAAGPASESSLFLRVAGELSSPALQPTVAGTIYTSRTEVLNDAKPIDQEIKQYARDIAGAVTSDPETDWSDGCEIGFSDAYINGYNGNTSGVRPQGPPAYEAAYAQVYSTSPAFSLGQAAKKRGDEYPTLRNEDPSIVSNQFSSCKSGYTAWIAANPQPVPRSDEQDFRTRYQAFQTRWGAFYESLFPEPYSVSALYGSDTDIETIRSYHDQFLGFVAEGKKHGVTATYVAPAPPAPSNLADQVKAVASSVTTTLVVGGVVVGGLLLLASRVQHS